MRMDPTLKETLRRSLPADRFRELMAAVASTPEPQGDWVARSRAFALFEPIRSAASFLRDSLERRGLAGGRDLRRLDLEGLLMEAIDRVVDGYGLGDATTVEEVVADLAPFVVQMDEAAGRAPDATFAARIAREALDILLNRHRRVEDIVESPNCAYVHRHLVPGPAPTSCEWPFLLLEEAVEDGRRVLRARQEAVIFSVRMLDFDLEEMGEVLEALLERQLRNGRYDVARRTAEQGRRVAAGYAAQIRRLIVETRRQPLATGYARRIAPVLDRARLHVDERRRRERELRSLADEIRFNTTLREVEDALTTIDRELEQCAEIYARLTDAIARAPIEHEEARARAFAARVAPGTWCDPLEDLLLPTLRGQAPALLEVGPPLLRRLAPPDHPRLPDLGRFVAAAFAESPALRALDRSEDDVPARRLPRPDLPLEEARRHVRDVVARAPRGVRLSELVAEAGEDAALAVALALVIHEWLKRLPSEVETTEGFRLSAGGSRLRISGVEYDDVSLVAVGVREAQPWATPRREQSLEATHAT